MSYEFVGMSGADPVGMSGDEDGGRSLLSWETLFCPFPDLFSGPVCWTYRASEALSQSHETGIAQLEARQAAANADAQRSEQAAAAANAGRAEAEFNEAKNQFGTSIVSAVPYILAAAVLGIGVIGYLLWRSSRQQVQYLPAPQYEYEVEQLEGVE